MAPLVPADKESLVCFLCTKTIGSGCILVKKANSDFGSSQPPAPSLSDSGSSSAILSLPEDFEAPQFITQVMCDVCDVKYKFCSQCGGGSIRTGKYRPTELFDNGRKTCSLAHVRLGDYINDFELLDITDGMSEDKYSALLSEMKNMHREFLLGFNAVPEVPSVCLASHTKSNALISR